MKTVTQWFDGAVKPVHIGVYERSIYGSGSTAFWNWNGQYWEHGGYRTPTVPRHRLVTPSLNQSLPWRGLAENPNGRSA